MKPKSIVTCLPSRDLDKSLNFYRKSFHIETSEIEEGMFIVELANLSLFVMSQKAYVQYTKKISLGAGYPDSLLQCIHSCAVEDKAAIDHVFASAEKYGGSIAQPMQENEWGQQSGYVRDPDGHVWEIVQIDT